MKLFYRRLYFLTLQRTYFCSIELDITFHAIECGIECGIELELAPVMGKVTTDDLHL